METGGGGGGWQDVSKVGYVVRHEQHIEILEHIRKFYCYKSVVFHTRRDVSSTVRLLK